MISDDSNHDYFSAFIRIAEEIPVPITCQDLHGHFLFANQAFAQRLGLTPGEIKGQTWRNLVGPEAAKRLIHSDQQVVVSNRKICTTEAHLFRSNGRATYAATANHTVAIDITRHPQIDSKGNIVGIRTFFTNATPVTPPAQELDMLRALMDNLPDSIYFKDFDSRFLKVSRAQLHQFSIASQAEIVGKSDADIFSQEHAVAARKDELEIMRTGVPIVNKIERETWADAPDTWASTTKMPLLDNQGNIIGTFGISRDVTRQVRTEEELRSAKEEADQANRAKSDFLANMSHEIRTPMNAVIGISELLLDTELTTFQREYLAMVLSSGESLLLLINDILDFSKIEAGKLKLKEESFDLCNVMGDTIRTLAVRAHTKNLELAFSVAPEVPEFVIGDRHRLRQIIVNLLGNAIKFTDQGEVVLEITLVEKTEEEALIKVAVHDTGIGIDNAQHEQIFCAFEQADGSSTRSYGGTGLGLAICKSLVELMQGEIGVESKIGQGSTFFFTARLKISKVNPSLDSTIYARITGTEVMVVDDNETNRKILCEMLKNWGLKPTSFADGPSALNQLKRYAQEKQGLPLILTDFCMPSMDGLKFVEHLRETPGIDDAKVIVLSSGLRPDSENQFKALGVIEQLQKPLKQSEVLNSIMATLPPVKNEMLPSTDTTAGQIAPSQQGVPASPADAQTGDAPTIPALSVLLAEDNAVNQKLAVAVLQREGHKVTVAKNGAEAVTYWKENSFDLVLMDVQMPIMDGFEATRAIRRMEAAQANGKHTFIVAVTARARDSDRAQCLKMGMDAYLSKPIHIADLCAILQRHALAKENQKTSSSPGVLGVPIAQKKPEPVSVAPIDWNLAVRSVAGDPNLLTIIVQTLIDTGPGLIKELDDGIKDGDSEKVRIAAHSLKGSVLFLGIDAVRIPSIAIEEAAEIRNFQDLPELFANLKLEYEAIEKQLHQFLANGAQ